MTADEIILDFGFNPNNGGRVVDEPARLNSRIVLTPTSAARLYQLLHALLAKRQEALQQSQTSPTSPSPAAGGTGTADSPA